MSLQHIQKNSPRLLPKPAKFEKNPPNGYRVIRKTKCGAAGAGGAGSSTIHKQASLAGRLINGGNIQQAEFNTKDSCKIALATGYRVYRLVPATQSCTLASTTGFRVYRPVPATQPCNTCFNNWFQSVPTGTGYTALYTCFNNWLQSVPTGAGYTALYTCFNLPVTKSTNRVLATQSLLYSASPPTGYIEKAGSI